MHRAKVGEKPLVVVTHSFGTIVFKKILEYAANGDPRMKSFIHNLKGAVFLGGPNNTNSSSNSTAAYIKQSWGLIGRFDQFGELAVSRDEATDLLVSSCRTLKATYYMSMRSCKKIQRLQESLDKLRLNVMTMSEGKKMLFGICTVPMVVVPREATVMKGYPDAHVPQKNHSELCMVTDENDPTLIEIKKFIEKSFKGLKSEQNKDRDPKEAKDKVLVNNDPQC